jgi:hypothetical protein
MTNEQKELVQTSWRNVVPVADTAATLFYDRLFEIDPSVLEKLPESWQQSGLRTAGMKRIRSVRIANVKY